jgi:hypothetical protein
MDFAPKLSHFSFVNARKKLGVHRLLFLAGSSSAGKTILVRETPGREQQRTPPAIG